MNNQDFFKGLALGLLVAVICVAYSFTFYEKETSQVCVPDQPLDKVYFPLTQTEPIVVVLNNNQIGQQIAGEINRVLSQLMSQQSQLQGGTTK